MNVFDRSLLLIRRERAAARFQSHDFLFRTVREHLCERLSEIRRDFPLVLDLGAMDGGMSSLLLGQNGIKRVLRAEACPAFHPDIVAEEEALPFHGPVFDLLVSTLALHWVNDLPGALIQIRRALKPDGLFLAALPGGETLHELRHAFMTAEIELTGGLASRFSPLVDLRDMGALLQRAGFALPVVDREIITVTYDDPRALIADLRGMGATHAAPCETRHPLRRDVAKRAFEIYRKVFAESDGRLPARFEIIYLAGWAPHESQQQPLARGSAQQSLASALLLPLNRGPDTKD